MMRAVLGIKFDLCVNVPHVTDAIEAAKYSAYAGPDTAPKCDADHASDTTA
jgi:hypothetical protein